MVPTSFLLSFVLPAPAGSLEQAAVADGQH